MFFPVYSVQQLHRKTKIDKLKIKISTWSIHIKRATAIIQTPKMLGMFLWLISSREKVCDVNNCFDNQNENTSAMLQIVKAGDW